MPPGYFVLLSFRETLSLRGRELGSTRERVSRILSLP